jgi:hypothetical protein
MKTVILFIDLTENKRLEIEILYYRQINEKQRTANMV